MEIKFRLKQQDCKNIKKEAKEKSSWQKRLS